MKWEEIEIPQIQYMQWAKLGALFGVISGVVVTFFLSALLILIIPIELVAFAGGFIILLIIVSGAAMYAVGAFVRSLLKFSHSDPLRRIFYNHATGALVFYGISILFGATFDIASLVLMIVLSLIFSWVVLKVAEKLKWRIPYP